MNQKLEEHPELGGKTSPNEDWYYRKQIKKMLYDFYNDVIKEEFKEETFLYDLNKFVDYWIEKHFPFNFGKMELPKVPNE